MEVRQYTPDMAKEWDNFIDNQSINGTFLQSRRFLNYHKNRFIDASLMFYRNNKLVCLCPACEVQDSSDKVFWSHKGSTFGGLIFNEKEYTSSHVIEIIKLMKQYLYENEYTQINLKITSDIFSSRSSDLLEYCLWQQGFEHYCELSTYVDYDVYGDDIYQNFNENHRRKKNKYEKKGAEYRQLHGNEEIRIFYDILSENLAKHGASPVHSLGELLDLRVRLPNEMDFFGIFLSDEMIAGTMMFYFRNIGIAHTQYLCSKQALDNVSPMSFLYFNILKTMRDKGFKKMSWGIATENQGKVLNNGLIWFKESVGSLHSVNRVYINFENQPPKKQISRE